MGVNSTKEIGEIEGIMLPLSVGAISADGFVVIDLFELNPYDTYAPFDELDIFNDSNSKVKVLINQRPDKYHPVAGKTEKIIGGIKLYSLRIEEQSSADIASGEIYLQLVKRGATPDTLAEGLVKRFRWLI